MTAAEDDAEFYRDVAADLVTEADALVVDVGCGGGGMALAMARRLRPDGRVVAVDLRDNVLDAARHHVLAQLPGDRPLPRVEFRTGAVEIGNRALHDLLGLGADLIWAASVIHHVGDQQSAVDLLATLLAPGGRLAICESGLNPRHLPFELELGRPGLESRLDAAIAAEYSTVRSAATTSKPITYGWTEALHRADLVLVTTRSYLIELAPPLSMTHRRRALEWLARRVKSTRSAGTLDADDAATWGRLLDPADVAWLGHREDMFRLEARTVHTGTRAASVTP